MHMIRALTSQRERLRPAGDLGVPVVTQRLHRRAGQRLVLPEQPVEGLLVGEAAVGEDGQQAREVLEDGAVLQEVRRDLAVAAAGNGHQLAVAKQLADPVRRGPQQLGDLRGGERVHRPPSLLRLPGPPRPCPPAGLTCPGAVTGASRWITTGERPAAPPAVRLGTSPTPLAQEPAVTGSVPTHSFDAAAASAAYRNALQVIGTVEPRVAEAIGAELADQRASLKLIASENYASPAVLLTMGN